MARRFFFGLTFVFALAGCSEGTTRAICASVLATRGEVLQFEQASANARQIDSQTKLCTNSGIRTSSKGEVDLILVPGALTRLLGDSELKIEQLELTKDGNETGDAIRARVAEIRLQRGQLLVEFEGFAKFSIETSQVTVAVLPSCLFRLEVDRSRTRLTCVRGVLYATPQGGQRVTVKGGSFYEWPSEHGEMRVTRDEKAEQDITDTLQASQELQKLAASRQDRLPE